jgi:hypothetical protein
VTRWLAVDWLDAYRDATLDQIIAMYSPDGVIECAPVEAGRSSRVRKAYRPTGDTVFFKYPRLNSKSCRWTEAVVVSYRTSSGVVQALLDTSEDGLITLCRCTPI